MIYTPAKKLKGLDLYIPPESDYRIRLDSNESPYPLPDALQKELADTVAKAAVNRYPDSRAEKLTEEAGRFFGISPDCITPGNGSDELIALLLGTLLEKGDNVLTISPDFSMYAFYGFLNELKIHTLQKEDDMKINVSKIIEYCNAYSVKAVIFSNPCNPTSLGVRRQDVERLIKGVACLVIVDEAYMDFWDQSVIEDINDLDNLIVLKTCSKNIGMAGLRLGFALTNPKLTEIIRAVKSPYNINSVTQAAGCFILRQKGLIAENTAKMISVRNDLKRALLDMSEHYFSIERVYDSVTNFVLIKNPKSKEIAERLAERSISVRLLGGYLRITAGTEEENREFLENFENILSAI